MLHALRRRDQEDPAPGQGVGRQARHRERVEQLRHQAGGGADYLDAIDSPMVGWHFDIGNVLKYGKPEEWIPVIGKRILKLHIKESKNRPVERLRRALLEGDDNWPAIMKAWTTSAITVGAFPNSRATS